MPEEKSSFKKFKENVSDIILKRLTMKVSAREEHLEEEKIKIQGYKEMIEDLSRILDDLYVGDD
jgi:hypothetical protein